MRIFTSYLLLAISIPALVVGFAFAFDTLLLGPILSAFAVLLAFALSGRTIGRVSPKGPVASNVDPQEVRAYRVAHPGATITVGIRHVPNSK
jgi:hypothetical protein